MIDINEIFTQDILWQMSFAERMAIFYLFNKIPRKKVAIEIGSYKGGFLRVLCRNFDTVYSLDINHSNLDKSLYPNAKWIEGDSKETLPALVSELNTNGVCVDFAMVDGDHSYKTVLADINNLLKLHVNHDMIIMGHDSWYPETRQAFVDADWNGNTHVHKIETDFVTGDLFRNTYVGGLALAVLSPEKRVGNVVVSQTNNYMHTTVTNLVKQSGL